MPKRTYTSPLRAASTAATRERILEAAQHCFEQKGFAGTTMRAIAERAGTSLESVNVTGTKRDLLMAALTRATTQVETDARLLDLPEPKAIFSDPDPAVGLSNLMLWVAASNKRTSRLWRCLDQAADTDEGIRTDYNDFLARMREEAARGISMLGERGALRPGIAESELADLLWLLVLPDQRRRLCDHAGWSQQKYEAWLCWSAKTTVLATCPHTTRS
ncbi:TetR/AcrR family transcriptional regulator [Paraburkholderia caffeinilytica]|uniref:TetR/AcrR family transcriptional regulator n=1 Tax=Paraburkholderia caffeinilytica TaxID=1761016 RepID=UPI0038BBC772